MHPVSLSSILILSSHLSPKSSLLFVFPYRSVVCISHLPHACYVPHLCHSLYFITLIMFGEVYNVGSVSTAFVRSKYSPRLFALERRKCIFLLL